MEASQKEAEEAQEQAVTRLWSWVCPSPGALPPGVGVWVGALASLQQPPMLSDGQVSLALGLSFLKQL